MRTGTIIGALLVSGLAVAGCTPSEEASQQPPTPGTPAGEKVAPAQVGGPEAPNSVAPAHTDHEFAQQLLSYDKQAKELTDLAKRSSDDEGVKQLAERLEQLQQPIQGRVEQWLQTRRDQGPASAPENRNVGEMTKMPPVEQGAMQGVTETRGEEFERQLALVLSEHIEHTVEMAHTELEDGVAPPMRDLAEELIKTREPLVKQGEELQAHL